MPHLRLTPRFSTIALLSLLLAGSAHAATLDVSPLGVGTTCTPGSPCALATANSQARPGDVIRLQPGTYITAPIPNLDGTAGARITYYGNLANPDGVIITPDVVMRKKYVTVKGMSFAGFFQFDRVATNPSQCAQFDSLAYANVYDSFRMDQAKDCMAYFVNVTGGGGRFTMSTPATPVSDWTIPERDTVRRCTFSLGANVTDGYHVVQIRGAYRCVIDSNQINIQMYAPLVQEIDPFIAFYMRNCQFKDNKWEVTNAGGANHLFRWRDSTMFNRVYRDTVILKGSGNLRFAPSSAGSYVGTTTQNYFEGLYVKCSTNPSDFALYYQNGMRRDTLKNCVVINSTGKAFTNGQVEKGTSLIDHCTFVGNSRYGVGEVVAGTNQWGPQWSSDGALVFTNNIVYQNSASSPGTESGWGWVFSAPDNQLTSNGNLFFLPGKSPSRALFWQVNTGGATYSGIGPGTQWATNFGRDLNSFWGSPRFADSSFTNFDPRPGPGSFAIGRALDGTDIGAFSPSGPDVTPPSTIGGLQIIDVFDNKTWLGWTAPGDDGSVGRAAVYELRYSTSPINAGNFPSATQVSPQPTPQPSGTVQNMIVLGLSPGTTYYFAIAARDEAGNWSPISYYTPLSTTPSDLRPPAAVRDLSTSP